MFACLRGDTTKVALSPSEDTVYGNIKGYYEALTIAMETV